MRIGELAKHAAVNIQTVRYYERRGLLPEPERRPSGYREYTAESLQRLRFIRRSQELGFTLSEIEDLLALRSASHASAEAIRSRVAEKVDNIEEKIRDLQRISAALVQVARECREHGAAPGACPLLNAIGQEPQQPGRGWPLREAPLRAHHP